MECKLQCSFSVEVSTQFICSVRRIACQSCQSIFYLVVDTLREGRGEARGRVLSGPVAVVGAVAVRVSAVCAAVPRVTTLPRWHPPPPVIAVYSMLPSSIIQYRIILATLEGGGGGGGGGGEEEEEEKRHNRTSEKA